MPVGNMMKWSNRWRLRKRRTIEPDKSRKRAAMTRSPRMMFLAWRTYGGFTNALVHRSGQLGSARCYQIAGTRAGRRAELGACGMDCHKKNGSPEG